MSQPFSALPLRASFPGVLITTIFLVTAAMLPSTIFFLASTSSQAPGLLIATIGLCLLIALGIGAQPSGVTAMNAVFGGLGFLVLVVVHGTIAALFVAPNFYRLVTSAVLLAALIIGGLILRDTFFRWRDQDLAVAALIVLFVCMGIAFVAVVGFEPVAYNFDRPVFPFTEPSHFALMVTPFVIYGCVRARSWRRLVLLAVFLFIAYWLKSLSLIVAITVAAGISLQIRQFVLVIAGVAALVYVVDISYFTDRVILNQTSDNLSQLVYLQGFELVTGSLLDTKGWGVGFQNLGFVPVNSPAADQIYRLLGSDANLKDGGFTAAKIISEFGILGAGFVAWLVFVAARASVRLRRVATKSMVAPAGTILAWSFLAGMTVELFIRGIGYFSPTTLFFVAAVNTRWSPNLTLPDHVNMASQEAAHRTPAA